MSKNKIIAIILKQVLLFLFYVGYASSWLKRNKNSEKFKIKTGIALLTAISLLSACNENEKNKEKESEKEVKKLKKSLININSITYSKVSKIIYLQIISCLGNNLSKEKEVIEIISEIEIFEPSENSNHDAMCYLPPPPRDSIYYKIK
ncbi:MAG: hypothetical protein JXR58_04375 [Bacteroidales bacterium]|nr:hypothetical protein [Bacteroidales bacterium]